MQVDLQKTVSITLTLSEEEAEWLHAVMQNPLHGLEPGEESRLDCTMRRRFFDATGIKLTLHEGF